MIHFFTPECRSTILIDREARRRRKASPGLEVYGPNELKVPRVSLREAVRIWARPFEMFVREPIVLFLSLLSGFSDALIFIFLEGFSAVYKAWDFSVLESAWAVIPINVAYFVTYVIYLPWIYRYTRTRNKKGGEFEAERRMKILLFLAPLEPIGLIGFAWTSLGPPRVHWIAPMIFSLLIGIANYAIYFSTVDYMIAAYGPYSASACGGNAFARDFLAGISAMFAIPMYEGIGSEYPTEWASTILAILSCMVVVPVYVFYWKGPAIRKKSKFAQALAEDRKAHGGRRVSQAGNLPYGEDPLA
jgi:MFS family permease